MSKKDRVVIFGTGWAFRNFIKNENHDYNILAVTDWEYQKHGEALNGIRVINPYDLKSLDYDYVLIVSTFVNEIKQQLWERCKIGEDKILVPFKHEVKNSKPFEDPYTHDFARTMIFCFSKLAADHGITLFLDYGTLLGFVRDGDVIKWDDDVDFSINHTDVDQFTDVLLKSRSKLPNANNIDWYVEIMKDSQNRIRNYSIRFKNKTDKKRFREFEFAVRVRKTFGNISVVMRGRYLACRAIHFQEHCEMMIKNQKLFLPNKYNTYLEFCYGNWKEPQKLNYEFKDPTLDISHLNIKKEQLSLSKLF